MKITDEQKERAKYINLPEFLKANGFELKKSGKEYIWTEHDSLHITDNGPGKIGKWYRFSTHEGGDNIAFIEKFMGKNFAEAVLLLNGESFENTRTYTNYQHKEITEKLPQEISLNEAGNCRRVFAYLCQTREIDYDLVSDCVRK